LEAFDKCCVQFLDAISNISSVITEETFGDYIFETFTTQLSDGSRIELKMGGKDIPVTWKNRNEFISLIEQVRMNEFQSQTSAIAVGIASIIPIHSLFIFTWQELEFLVCSRPGIDISVLKKKTVYRGIAPTDRHVLDFWEILNSLSPPEQSLFVRFISGRSRLPPENEFTQNFSTSCVHKRHRSQSR